VLVTLALICAVAARTSRKKDTGTLVLKHADTNENALVRGELVSTLIGNVVFLYDDFTIYSDNARWWQDKGVVTLNGNVRVERGPKVMRCDQMTFQKERRTVEGTGRVDYRDSTDGVRIYGRRGVYDMARKEVVLTGDPHFVRTSPSAGATARAEDTLEIVGQELTYHDSLRLATARKRVRITRGPLVATCDRADYATRLEQGHLRVKPFITYEQHTMDGDSVDLFFRGDTLDGVSVDGHAHGIYREADSADTTLTNVWGDSMYLAMTPSGDLDSVWAWGNVLSTYYLSAEEDSANRVSGKAMILAFEQGRGLRSALVWGNAASTYYVSERDSRGRNEASGDTIHVFFRSGKASELVLSGAVRGTYSPRE